MKRISRVGIAAAVAFLLVVVLVSGPAMGAGITKQSVLDKFNNVRESPLFSEYLREFSAFQEAGGTSQNSFSIINSISSNQFCSTCGGAAPYTVINHYLSGDTFYPDPVQPSEREFGSMIVSGSDDGGPYYLWVKPLFFATDIEDYYDMRWHYCGILPVQFDKNILSGEYCLKVTKSPSTKAKSVWCGNAIVAPNQTTTVNLPSYLSGCPFGCNNCC